MPATPLVVHDQGGYHNSQQHRPHQRAYRADRATGTDPEAPQAQQPHAGRLPEEAHEEGVLDEEHTDRSPALGHRVGEQPRDEQAQQPVDHQGAEPAAEACRRNQLPSTGTRSSVRRR